MRRWNEISRVRASMSIRGEFIARQGLAGILDDVRVEGSTRDQCLRITNFGSPERAAVFRPDRTCIEEANGSVLAQRDEPRASFDRHTEAPSWDPLHLAYFSGYAAWECLATPFFITGADFQTEELAPWQEDGEIWRRLFVWFPKTIATHASQQTLYFGPDGLLRRVDYCAELAGGVEVANYCTEPKAFSGITLPTRRRLLSRDLKGNVEPAPFLMEVSIFDATFW
jgi:hypothetical protein